MESLATVVLILFILLMISGPITIGLTSRRVQTFTDRYRGATALRRLFALGIGIEGIFIAINFIYATTPLAPKLLAIIAIGGNIYAVRREIKFAKSR